MSEGAFLLVVLDEELPVHPRELAPTLAGAFGRVRYDVLNALKHDPHIPFKDLTEEAAGAAGRCLADAGVRAAIVPAGRLPPPAKLFRVVNADVEAEGLAVQIDLAGNMRKLPWGGIEVVSAATFSETSTPLGLSGHSVQDDIEAAKRAHWGRGAGYYQLRSPDIPKPQAKTEAYPVLCLMPRGAPIEIRFRGDLFNYDYLGERLVTDSEQNFRTFVGDIVARTPQALVNRWALRLTESGEPPPVFEEHMLERYNLWLRLRAREGL